MKRRSRKSVNAGPHFDPFSADKAKEAMGALNRWGRSFTYVGVWLRVGFLVSSFNAVELQALHNAGVLNGNDVRALKKHRLLR